ncbi:MAG TPA: D-amino-acid transaminase [Caulobacteraceae bacterium]|jgi:D-alanine transaminase
MSRVAYVNGRYVPHADARVHIEDRGYQFADGIYEVWALLDGRLAEWDGHAERLERSLSELRIRRPMGREALRAVLRETVRQNRVRDGLVYIQVTRGQAPRDHAFPLPEPEPSVVVTVKRIDLAAVEARAAKGVAVVTTPDDRWGRCDIKTVGLLSNVLAKQRAKAAGAFEAWFVDDLGLVTEGSSTNAWIVDAEGVLRTRGTNCNILRGVTRRSLIEVARANGIEVSERPFSVVDAKAAREAFFTSASAFVMPVVSVDGAPIGDGAPGETTRKLRQLYLDRARREAI